MKKLRVTVAGKVYEVTVEILEEDGSSSPQPSRQIAPPSPQEQVTPVTIPPVHIAPKGIVSPMAGRVVAISAQVGQTVREGDQLIIIEAMKMNNHLYAPQGGQISAILVKIGDAVEEGQQLLLFS